MLKKSYCKKLQAFAFSCAHRFKSFQVTAMPYGNGKIELSVAHCEEDAAIFKENLFKEAFSNTKN